MNHKDEVIDEVIKDEVDKKLLPVMPTDEIPENCVVKYRSELDPSSKSILIVEVVWKVDANCADEMRCSLPIDRRVIGRYETDLQGKAISKRIVAYLNANHSNI